MVRLNKNQWDIIEYEIYNNVPISEIAKHFNISRHSIYQKAWRYGWIKKKRLSLWNKLKNLINKNKKIWCPRCEDKFDKTHSCFKQEYKNLKQIEQWTEKKS